MTDKLNSFTITARNMSLFWQILVGNNLLAILLVVILWFLGYFKDLQNFFVLPVLIFFGIIILMAFIRGLMSALKARRFKTIIISPEEIRYSIHGEAEKIIPAGQINSIKFINLNYLYKSILINYQANHQRQLILLDPSIFDQNTINQIAQALIKHNYIVS